MSRRKPFRLDRLDRKLLGVCAGIADYTGIDATIVRVAFVVATIALFPWPLIAYALIAWAARPKGEYLDVEERRTVRVSTRRMRESMSDIDRRMAEVESYVTSSNSRLAREIEQLR